MILIHESLTLEICRSLAEIGYTDKAPFDEAAAWFLDLLFMMTWLEVREVRGGNLQNELELFICSFLFLDRTLLLEKMFCVVLPAAAVCNRVNVFRFIKFVCERTGPPRPVLIAMLSFVMGGPKLLLSSSSNESI